VAFISDRVIVSGIRGVTAPIASSIITLHNAGSTAQQVTAFSFGGTTGTNTSGSPLVALNAKQFQVTTAVPATIMPGGDLSVTVEMLTTGANLPAVVGSAPYSPQGSTLLADTLTATLGSETVEASVYGLLLVPPSTGTPPTYYEPTLGQIITTLGYDLDVGKAQNNWNPNTIDGAQNAVTLPGVEANTDEVAAPLFVKAAGAVSVTMTVVARYSPEGSLPYGWYPSTSSATLNVVGTMSMSTDAQTANKARMVYPPLAAGSATTFDPGTASFGIWIYSDQKTQKFGEGGNAVNGDYDYSQDALNVPTNTPPVHRVKAYPLKDATGTVIPRSYMIAVEEAANGDYQDYVFVLGDVEVAP
jgi:hypothetical protein